MKATSEEAFEALIEQHLLDHGGYVSRSPDAYDANLAVMADDLLGYVQATQPKTWAKQVAIHGDNVGTNLLAAFDKAAARRGVPHILRHGFKFYGSLVRVATCQPAHGLSSR